MKKFLVTVLAAVAVWAGCTKPETADVKVRSLQMTSGTATVQVGQTTKLAVIVAPSDATNKGVNWSSSNEAVATVDADGVVTGVASGNATITATAKDGSGVKASCTVTVEGGGEGPGEIKVTGITLTEVGVLEMALGSETAIEAVIEPDNATNKEVEWVFSNPSVAEYSGGKIIAKESGTTELVVKAKDGSNVESDKLIITVLSIKSMFVKYPHSLLRTGGSLQQKAWYGSVDDYPNRDPRNGIVNGLIWTSETPAVATIDDAGLITAVSAGKARMTVKDVAGSSVSFDVLVEDATEHEYDDYLPGIPLIDCHDGTLASNWKANTKNGEGYSLKEGYVPGTQCMGATINGYKIAEVFLKDYIDVSKINNPALFLRVYIDDPSKMTTVVRGGEPYVEIRSTDELGVYQETESKFSWNLKDIFTNMDGASESAKQTLVAGWNNIVLPFDMGTGRVADKTGITYFRIYQMHGQPSYNEVEWRFDQIRVIDWTELENCDNFAMWRDWPAQENQYSYFHDTEGQAEGTGCVATVNHLFTSVSCFRLEMWPGLERAIPAMLNLEELKLQYKFYVEDEDDVEWFKNRVHVRVELGNAGFTHEDFKPDAQAIEMSVGATTSSPLNITSGWNTMTLNFSDFMSDIHEGFDVHKLGYLRVIYTPLGALPEEYGYRTYKIDDFRILKK